MKELKAKSKKIEVLYVGAEGGLEKEIIPPLNITLKTTKVEGLPRRFGFEQLRALSLFSKAFFQSLSILRQFRPEVVVGTGGYASAPLLAAAFVLRVPTLIQEQNVTPGLVNRYFGKLAKVVAISYPKTKSYFSKKKKVVLVGNPLRAEVLQARRAEGLKLLGLEGKRKTLLVCGGSRGARTINQAMIEAYELFRPCDLQIIHITGKLEFDKVSQEVASLKKESDKVSYQCHPYIGEIGLVYAVSELILARAGATTIAEICAWGLPAILVPYPYSTGAHQRENAQMLEREGVALVIENDKLDGKILYEEVTRLLDNPRALHVMGKKAKNLSRPSAAEELAKVVTKLAKNNLG